MAGLGWDQIIEVLVDVIVKVLGSLVNSGKVPLDTRAENRNQLVVFVRPSIKLASIIFAHLFAVFTVDTEADVAHEDFAATASLWVHVEDCGLFPLEIIMAIN